jgi:hypothetical protein
MNRSVTVTWQDPQPLAQAGRSLSGLEFLRAIRDKKLPSPPSRPASGTTTRSAWCTAASP